MSSSDGDGGASGSADGAASTESGTATGEGGEDILAQASDADASREPPAEGGTEDSSFPGDTGASDSALAADTGASDSSSRSEGGAADSAAPDTGAAACGPSTCAGGCCNTAGACVPFANESTATCGAGGSACGPCSGGEQCNLSTGVCACPQGMTACSGTCIDVGATDANNCGSCGHGCGGGNCSAGVCQPFSFSSSTSPTGLAVNESNVYWTESGGNVNRQPVSGTSDTPLYSDGLITLDGAISLSSTKVYFVVQESGSSYVQGNLLAGGGGSTFDATSQPNHLAALTLDANNLYVSSYDSATQGGGCSAAINVVPLNGNPITNPYGACTVVRMAVDATNIYWTDSGPPNGLITPAVMMQSLTGTPAATQVTTAQAPYAIAIVNGVLYWTDTVAGMVMKYVVGGNASPSTFGASSAPTDMAADSSGVYWIDSNATILHLPLTGGTVQTLATQQTDAVAIATNSTSVFWVNQGTSANAFADGAVMKLAK
ncbi:MAG TPA: hypothetical protein VK841_00015 [Polyangiaceae bacterium]|nr:hypothetical protein [Polyangiaceae bacterium]